jgi:hypothetical protein
VRMLLLLPTPPSTDYMQDIDLGAT